MAPAASGRYRYRGVRVTGPEHSGQADAFGRAVSPEKPSPPRRVVLARWLWIAGTALWIVRAVLQLADRRMLIDQLRRMAPELSQSEVDAAANSGILLSLVFALLIGAVGLLLAQRMLEGRNWARVLVTVVTAFSVVSTALMLVGLATAGSTLRVEGSVVRIDPVNILLSVVVAGISAAVLISLWHPESTSYFHQAARRAREQRTSGSGTHGP